VDTAELLRVGSDKSHELYFTPLELISGSSRWKTKKRESQNRADKIEQRCMQVKTEMKRKVGKDPEGGSKKRKELGNESPLASMLQKKKIGNGLKKGRDSYNAIIEKGKEFGLDSWTRQRMQRMCFFN
jgi:hypothetical protein